MLQNLKKQVRILNPDISFVLQCIFELAGLSVREINGDEFSEPFIPALDYIRNRKPVINKDHDLWEDIHRGSYPTLIDGGTDWELFYSSYVQTYINRDINDMSNIKDKLKFSTFILNS